MSNFLLLGANYSPIKKSCKKETQNPHLILKEQNFKAIFALFFTKDTRVRVKPKNGSSNGV